MAELLSTKKNSKSNAQSESWQSAMNNEKNGDYIDRRKVCGVESNLLWIKMRSEWLTETDL